MKKRFLASTLAILMATGALATSASAATPYDPEGFVDPAADQTTAGAGSASATVSGEIVLGSIKVQVPSEFNYVLNPYGLDVEIDDPDDDGDETITVQDKFLTKAGYMANKGDFAVDINIGLLAAPSAGSGIEIIASTGEFTDKKVQAKVGLEVVDGGTLKDLVESGDAELTAEGGITEPEFTFTGAPTIDATVRTRVQPSDAAQVNYELAGANVTKVTLLKGTATKVAADGETAVDETHPEAGTIHSYPAVGLKLTAEIQDKADWTADDKFDAIVVWDIQRNYD